jgi:hypothetical protein
VEKKDEIISKTKKMLEIIQDNVGKIVKSNSSASLSTQSSSDSSSNSDSNSSSSSYSSSSSSGSSSARTKTGHISTKSINLKSKTENKVLTK